MRVDAHVGSTTTIVRGAAVLRDDALRFDGTRAFAIATALGPPRLWGSLRRVVFAAAQRSLQDGRSHDSRSRLAKCASAAREALVDYGDALLERAIPDCALTLVLFEQGQLHVHAVGNARVYLQRGAAAPSRLTPRDAPVVGLVYGQPTVCSLPVEPFDLVMMGTESAFSPDAIANVAASIATNADTDVATLTKRLLDPARSAETGGAAAVVRVA